MVLKSSQVCLARYSFLFDISGCWIVDGGIYQRRVRGCISSRSCQICSRWWRRILGICRCGCLYHIGSRISPGSGLLIRRLRCYHRMLVDNVLMMGSTRCRNTAPSNTHNSKPSRARERQRKTLQCKQQHHLILIYFQVQNNLPERYDEWNPETNRNTTWLYIA